MHALRTIAIGSAALSATALIRDEFAISLPPVLGSIINAYSLWLNDLVTLGLDSFVASLLVASGEEGVHLLPQSTHVFVLLWLLFASYAWTVGRSYGQRLSAFAWVSGLFCATFGSALAGMVEGAHIDVLWPLLSIAVFAVLQVSCRLVFAPSLSRTVSS